jgi:excisionase family DNA binding protein
MTAKEAAERLGLSETRVKQLINAGKLIAEKRGRYWEVSESELLRFIQLERASGHPVWVAKQRR